MKLHKEKTQKLEQDRLLQFELEMAQLESGSFRFPPRGLTVRTVDFWFFKSDISERMPKMFTV